MLQAIKNYWASLLPETHVTQGRVKWWNPLEGCGFAAVGRREVYINRAMFPNESAALLKSSPRESFKDARQRLDRHIAITNGKECDEGDILEITYYEEKRKQRTLYKAVAAKWVGRGKSA